MWYNKLTSIIFTEENDMEQNKTELSVNTEVFEKMAEIAAKEVEIYSIAPDEC